MAWRGGGIRARSWCGFTVLAALAPLAFSSGCAICNANGDQAWIARSRSGMVAADHPQASQIGAQVLKDGGNAFDAAIATSLALTVCRPESTGIGGGGFLIAYVADQRRFVALDFREMAPASATPERFAALDAARGDGPSASIYGGNAVGVPGLLAGLGEIHRRYATQDWKTLVLPAAALARKGFTADKATCETIVDTLDEFKRYLRFREEFAPLLRRIAPDGSPRRAGGRWKRPDLAKTLDIIAAGGPEAFYEGPIAAAIVEAVRAAGGELTHEDLRGYRVREREPLRFSTKPASRGDEGELQWITMPPPSSGGVCLAELLLVDAAMSRQRQAEDAQISSSAGRFVVNERTVVWAAQRIESMKHAFADRARFLSDSDFCPVPLKGLIDPARAERLAADILAGVRPKLDDYGMPPPDDRGTSHFCIADRFGNIVAMTETINGGYGSYVVVEPYGIILNNQMDDFTTVVGKANLFGLIQSRGNLVAPGKRPLSSMTPTIVLRNGRPILAIGASGGPRIITSVFQVAAQVVSGAPLESALVEPRIHHQWQPNQFHLDREPSQAWPAVVQELIARGYPYSEKRRGAVVQAIQIELDGTLVGACDPKKGGRPAADANWASP
ncbi:MAG: gamma-glutamyltransferase [Planctomycetes bacterium]|nr:gamma-glutamyltransferase [Planctomycetota bacterium]